jgi:Fur family iron response transcriptional regulator
MGGMTEHSAQRPFAGTIDRLRSVGLRPTRQRLALARLLLEGGDRHVSAEALHQEVKEAGFKISLATIYNTLHQFTQAGLLREVVVEAGRSYFDTNITDHHHFFLPESGTLKDIPGDQVTMNLLPEAPEGTEIDRVDVIVRLKETE